MPNNISIVVSAPSGTGKTSIITKAIEENDRFVFVVSTTTRPQRNGESEGESYYYVSQDDFKQMIVRGEFLEWAVVHGTEYYGVLRESVQQNLDANRLIIREVDVQGVQSIKQILPREQLLTIFLAPENESVLLSRIAGREPMTEEELARRMESMQREMAEAANYDYKIINYEGQIERCYLEVEGIIRSAAERRGIILTGGGGALV